MQVDGTTVAEPDGSPPAGEAPTEPVVTTLAAAAELYPDLVGERLGSLAAADDPFVARNDAAWRGGAFVYVPNGEPPRAPAQIAAVHDTDGVAIGFRTLIVLEEGAEAEVWEQWLATDEERSGLFNTVTEIFVGPGREPPLRHGPGPGREQLGVRHAAGRGRARRDARLGRPRVRLGARQGPDGDPPGRARARTPRSPAPTPATATQHLDFDTTQEHASHDTVSDLAFRGVLERRRRPRSGAG